MSIWGRELSRLDGQGGSEPVSAGHPYIYYRLYTEDNPLESKNPIYSNDRCISRILIKSVAPPRNVASLKKHLWKIKDFDGTPTSTLYLSLSEKAPADDLTRLPLKGGPGSGSSELYPMALVVETPKLRKKFAMASKVDSKTLPEWPHEQSYVYYRVYEEAGDVSSKTSFDEIDLSLGRVTALSVPPPHNGASLKARLIQAEKIPSQNVKLFKDDAGENILNHNDVINLLSEYFPGVLLNDPMAIVYGPKKQEDTSHQTRDRHGSNGSRSTAPKPRPPLLNAHDSTRSSVGSAYERKINDAESIKEKPDTTERLDQLRKLMAKDTLDYYVVPSEDAHQSEYVAASDKRREFISGFSGSAGQAIVSKSFAYLITDSRYWLQAQEQVDENWTLIRARSNGEPKDWIEWIVGRVKGARIGIDARMLSHEKARLLNTTLPRLDSKIVYPPQNLVDLVWRDKPPKPKEPVYEQGTEFTGKDALYKLTKIREWIRQQPASTSTFSKGDPTPAQIHVGTLITSLSYIAYTLNLCGSDIPYNSLFHAYLFVSLDTAILFLDSSKVVDRLADYLRRIAVERRGYTDLWPFLRKKEWGDRRVLLAPQTPYAISLMLTHYRYMIAPSYIEHMMSVEPNENPDGSG